MLLIKCLVFKLIVIELFFLVQSDDKIINGNVIEIPVTSNSTQYPDYRILFSIDITKNNSAFNSTYNNSDLLIVDDSRLSPSGGININILE